MGRGLKMYYIHIPTAHKECRHTDYKHVLIKKISKKKTKGKMAGTNSTMFIKALIKWQVLSDCI